MKQLAALCLFAAMVMPGGAAIAALQTAPPGTRCARAARALSVLRQQFGETPAFIGNLSDGSSIILTERRDEGTWTLLAIGGTPAVACEIAEGKAPDPSMPAQ